MRSVYDLRIPSRQACAAILSPRALRSCFACPRGVIVCVGHQWLVAQGIVTLHTVCRLGRRMDYLGAPAPSRPSTCGFLKRARNHSASLACDPLGAPSNAPSQPISPTHRLLRQHDLVPPTGSATLLRNLDHMVLGSSPHLPITTGQYTGTDLAFVCLRYVTAILYIIAVTLNGIGFR